MSRFTSDWLNLSLLSTPGFFFEGEGGGGGSETKTETETETETTTETSPKTYDEATVKALREEAAANRRKLREAEAELAKRKDAELSETERLKKEADEAKTRADATEQKSRARVAKAETLTAATEAGFIKPSLAYDLIAGRIEFDDDGEPKNVADLLKKLGEENPFLLKGEGGGQNTSHTNGASGRGGKWTAEAVEKLAAANPAEFNRRWNAGEFKGIL